MKGSCFILSLSSRSFVCYLSKPQLVWPNLRWAQMHCLETTLSIMTVGTLWGLNPWSQYQWLSVWICTGQMGKTIMSYTGCCCLSGQRRYHFYPIQATPSAEFVGPWPQCSIVFVSIPVFFKLLVVDIYCAWLRAINFQVSLLIIAAVFVISRLHSYTICNYIQYNYI